MSNIKIPKYSLSEELINSISHGIASLLAIAALVLLIIKSKNPLSTVSVTIYASIMIILYIISTIYHALSPKLKGKKVLRVIDHCNVLLMVFGTYMPVALLGIKNALGWTLFGITLTLTIISITLTAINVDKYQIPEVIFTLIIGWSSVIGIPNLIHNTSINAFYLLLAGGIVYSIGAILYAIGSKKKYIHSVFHFFVIAASTLHFLMIYLYLI